MNGDALDPLLHHWPVFGVNPDVLQLLERVKAVDDPEEIRPLFRRGDD